MTESKKSRKRIVISIVIIAVLIVGLVAMPPIKYLLWSNETIDQANKVTDVLNKNNIDAEMDKVIAGKNTDKKIYEKLNKMVNENISTLEESKKIIKPGDGFWGIDLSGKKAETIKKSDELINIYDDLILDAKDLLTIIDMVEALDTINNADMDMDNEAAILKAADYFEKVGKDIFAVTKNTSYKKEGAEFNKIMISTGDNMRNMMKYAKAGNESKMNFHIDQMEKDMNNLEKIIDKMVNDIDEISKKHSANIDAYNKALDRL